MGREFEISRDVVVESTPDQVFDAVTRNTGAWLWPMEFEPRLGGAAAGIGRVTAWEPPHRFAVRAEDAGGWYNSVDHVIEARDGGMVALHYVHSGVFEGDWEAQYDGAGKHTDFYLATLNEYLKHFRGRSATYAAADGSMAAAEPDSFDRLRGALGLGADVSLGDRVRLAPAGTDPVDAEVDHLSEHFLGLRSDDALYRFFGRNAFGGPVGLSVHHFGADADSKRLTTAWQKWLDDVYA